MSTHKNHFCRNCLNILNLKLWGKIILPLLMMGNHSIVISSISDFPTYLPPTPFPGKPKTSFRKNPQEGRILTGKKQTNGQGKIGELFFVFSIDFGLRHLKTFPGIKDPSFRYLQLLRALLHNQRTISKLRLVQQTIQTVIEEKTIFGTSALRKGPLSLNPTVKIENPKP